MHELYITERVLIQINLFQIPVKHDLPGVGQNFHEQPVILGFTFLTDKGMGLTQFDLFNPWSFFQYKYTQTGITNYYW